MHYGLLTVFPCINTESINSGLGRKSDPFGNSIGYYYEISGFLWSIGKFIVPNFKGLVSFIRGIETHNTLVIYQAYSILFAISISFVLLKLKPIYKKSILLYSKFKHIKLIFILLSICCVLVFLREGELISYWNNTTIWNKTLFFLLLYFSLLIIYVVFQRYHKIRYNEIIVLVFILFFPTISVTSDIFNTITADTVPRYERSLNIVPLISALPSTIKYLVSDLYFQMKYYDFSIKLYTLFQISMVLFVFPSLLTPKINQNG